MRLYEINNKTSINNKLGIVVNTNAFIRLEYVKSFVTFKEIGENKPISKSMDDFSRFADDLKEYEITNIVGKHIDSCNNYGVILTFMLDKKHSKEELESIINGIISKDEYKGLPYFSWVKQKGKGFYLNIYFCERFYFPNGQEIILKQAKKDSYKSSVTGKACKKDDVGAYLWHKKGDIISKKVANFSKKVRVFRFAQHTKEFTYYINELKQFFIKLLNKLVGMPIEFKATLRKFTEKILDDKQKQNARIYNYALRQMEDSYNFAVNGLLIIGSFEEQRKKLDNLLIKYNRHLKTNRHFKVNNSIRFVIDFNDKYNTAKNNADLLLTMFKNELNGIMAKLV